MRFAVSLGLLTLLACTPPDERDPEPTRIGIPLERDIQGLDPQAPERLTITTGQVLLQLYEGLVDYDPETLQPVARLASGWTVSEDRRTWTFPLRPGVRFTDSGRPLTSHDVVASLRRGLAVLERTGEFPGIPPALHLEAADDHTVRVVLGQPSHALLHLLAHVRMVVVDEEVVAETGDLTLRPAGTGPFRLASWVPDSDLLLVRNPDYWGRSAGGRPLPLVDAVELAVADASSPLYSQGLLDAIFGYWADPPPLPGGTVHHRVPWFNTIFAGFDRRSDHPVVQDRELRRVVSLAVVRPDAASANIHAAAAGLLPPSLAAPGRLRGQRTDPEAAARLLTRLDLGPLPPVRIAWLERDRVTGVLLGQALEDLGWTVELTFHGGVGDVRTAVASGEADLFRSGWLADYPDPYNFLELFGSGSGNNWGGWEDPAYDEDLARLAAGPEAGEVRALVRGLEGRLLDDVAAIFLRHENQDQWVSARLMGWSPACANPLNRPHFERVGRLR